MLHKERKKKQSYSCVIVDAILDKCCHYLDLHMREHFITVEIQSCFLLNVYKCTHVQSTVLLAQTLLHF